MINGLSDAKPFIHLFIHSGHFYSASSSQLLLSTDTAPEFHAEAPQAIANEGLAQGPYVAVRAGFEPTTLRTKGVVYTNAPPRPIHHFSAALA